MPDGTVVPRPQLPLESMVRRSVSPVVKRKSSPTTETSGAVDVVPSSILMRALTSPLDVKSATVSVDPESTVRVRVGEAVPMPTRCEPSIVTALTLSVQKCKASPVAPIKLPLPEVESVIFK